jgi:chlorite dismutase
MSTPSGQAEKPPEPPAQVVKFTFFHVAPEWRRRSDEQRAKDRAEFAQTVDKFRDALILNSYSTVGTRGDADLLLWCVGQRVEDIQALHAALNSTALGGFLTVTQSFLSMTRRSQYIRGHEHAGGHGAEKRIHPGEGKYLVVYPFWKTHDWYQLSFEKRTELMAEHFRIGHKYPAIKIHTTYSFGLDDQEFVLAFEFDDLELFLKMVEELRGAKQRPYTMRDTPILTGVRQPLADALRMLG